MQLCRQDADGLRLLEDTSRQVRAPRCGGVIAHAEVGVVLNAVDGYAQLRVGLVVREESLDACAGLLGEAVVPPEFLRVVAAEVERGVLPVEIGACRQADGIAEEREVQVGVEVHFQLSGILTDNPELAHHVEVQRAALRLVDLSADADIVLRPCVLEG